MNELEDIKLLITIKHLYYEYVLTNDRIHLDKMFILYIDANVDGEYLKSLNNIIDEYDLFLDVLYYTAFLMNYNLKYEYYIDTYEQIYIDILYSEYDESMKVYFDYKKKYIDEYVGRNL